MNKIILTSLFVLGTMGILASTDAFASPRHSNNNCSYSRTTYRAPVRVYRYHRHVRRVKVCRQVRVYRHRWVTQCHWVVR